jgi:hypothetical protein
LPVSKTISWPPISTETLARCSVAMLISLLPPLCLRRVEV